MALKDPRLDPKKDYPDYGNLALKVQNLANALKVAHESGNKQYIASTISQTFGAAMPSQASTAWDLAGGATEFYGDLGTAGKSIYSAAQERSILALFRKEKTPFTEEVGVIAGQVIASVHQRVLGGSSWTQFTDDPIGYLSDWFLSGDKSWTQLREERANKESYAELIKAGVDNDGATALTGVTADAKGVLWVVGAPAYMNDPERRGAYILAANAYKNKEALKEAGWSARDTGWWATAAFTSSMAGVSPVTVGLTAVTVTPAAVKMGPSAVKGTLTHDLALKYLREQGHNIQPKKGWATMALTRSDEAKLLKQWGLAQDVVDDALAKANQQIKTGGLKGAWAQAAGKTTLRVMAKGVSVLAVPMSAWDSYESFERAGVSALRGDGAAQIANNVQGGAMVAAAGLGVAGLGAFLFSNPVGWTLLAVGGGIGLIGGFGDDILDTLGLVDAHNNDQAQRLLELAKSKAQIEHMHGASHAEVLDALQKKEGPIYEQLEKLAGSVVQHSRRKRSAESELGALEKYVQKKMMSDGPSDVFTLPSTFYRALKRDTIKKMLEQKPSLSEDQASTLVDVSKTVPSAYPKGEPLRASDILDYLGTNPNAIKRSPLSMLLKSQGFTDQDMGSLIKQAKEQVVADKHAWVQEFIIDKDWSVLPPNPVFVLKQKVGALKVGSTIGFDGEKGLEKSWDSYHLVHAWMIKQQFDLVQKMKKGVEEGKDVSGLLKKAEEATVRSRQVVSGGSDQKRVAQDSSLAGVVIAKAKTSMAIPDRL